MKQMFILFALALFTMTIPVSYSRSPAVEPVSGLSIDRYQDKSKKVNIEKSRFNIPENSASLKVTKESESLLQNTSNVENSSFLSQLLLTLAILLPMGLWMAMAIKIRRESPPRERRSQADAPGLVRIHDRRKSNSHEEDQSDDDISQAS